MKIYLITPIYAVTTEGDGATPVVHYFAKEWIKQGNQVTVFHFMPKYPRIFYSIAKKFRHRLYSITGIPIPTHYPHDSDYITDGVKVYKRTISKIVPHSLYRKTQIDKALSIIEKECRLNGIPDVFVGHWDNPQLEILNELKNKYGIKTCLVLHENEFKFEKKYGYRAQSLLNNIDIIGFRSLVGRNNYMTQYGEPRKSFVAYSGVSSVFIKEGSNHKVTHPLPLRRFVYVGSLIKRKHPVEVLRTLYNIYPDGNFIINYIGDGQESITIEQEQKINHNKGTVLLHGRIAREEIIKYLKESDVFVMISEEEIFGLVYLEAMALGLITIGSKREGIDGIIIDGENGFLCEPSSVEDLEATIRRINSLSEEQIKKISDNAKITALGFSDSEVANQYINALK